jgi:hypothetical protein
MKKFAVLLLSILSIHCLGQKNSLDKPKVDQRIELLSIVFRLAECDEYSSTRFKLYTDKIYQHYEPYKNHELIKFTKQLREKTGVSYDAVMSMAIHINNDLDPIVKFTDKIPDRRWGKRDGEKFVKLLKQFYKDSQSEQFFKENAQLYQEVSTRFSPIYENLDLNWYTAFYGKEPNEKFIIVNGLGNGGGNYGPSITHPNGEREVYAVMGTWKVDSAGLAIFAMNSYFPTLVHEFNHSFVNYLLAQNLNLFEKNGETIYAVVKDEMNSQAYGEWRTMLNEALVRASVIKYMKDHHFPQQEIDDETNRQLDRGFAWIQELVTELENYDGHRDVYPTLESYLPIIAKAYDTYANNIHVYVKNHDENRPKVISISEFPNGSQEVESTLKKITINFDRPLLGKGYSINYGESEKQFPAIKKVSYADDKKSIDIEWELEKNKEYSFVLSGLSFKTAEGASIKDYQVKFKTK